MPPMNQNSSKSISRNIFIFHFYPRGYTILGLNGFNNLARPTLGGGGVNLNIVPSNSVPSVGTGNLVTRYCDKGK